VDKEHGIAFGYLLLWAYPPTSVNRFFLNKEKNMKKLLALALGALLVASAVPAFAESRVEFSGFFKAYYQSLHNFNRSVDYHDGGDTVRGRDSEAFFQNRLQIDVTFRPTDEIAINWRFRGPHYGKWGSGDSYNLFTRFIYGEITQPWGPVVVGRLADGLPGTVLGLANLGYAPSYGNEFLYNQVFDINDVVDGIAYVNSWDNGFGLAAWYVKAASNPYTADYGNYFTDYYSEWISANPGLFTVSPATANKDADYDHFGIEPHYKWADGGVSLALIYERDKTSPVVSSDYAFFINPALVQNWGPFSIHFEAKIGWGRTRISKNYIRDHANVTPGREADFDAFLDDLRTSERRTGLGIYLDGSYNYGAGDVTLAGWFVDGTAWHRRDGGAPEQERTDHDLVNLGDFAPFLVAFNATTWGSSGRGSRSKTLISKYGDEGGQNEGTNQWGIAILGNHSFTDDIKFNYGIGYFRAVEAPYWQDDDGDYHSFSKDLGWEIDAGITIQLLDNLTFESQFGYMFNGGYYDQPIVNSAGKTALRSAKNTYAWANVLAFTF
jgi:hypothetical protein